MSGWAFFRSEILHQFDELEDSPVFVFGAHKRAFLQSIFYRGLYKGVA